MKALLRFVVWPAAFLLFAGGCRDAPVPPNIIVVLTDDQVSSSLRFMSKVESSLVGEGVSFSNFYINDPICCPSRVTIFTGQYHHNHGIEIDPFPNSCGQRFMEEGLQLRGMGKRLQAAGYRTIFIGKLLNKYNRYVSAFGKEESEGSVLLGWDEYHALIRNQYYGYSIHHQGTIAARPRSESFYQTDEFARLASTYIYESSGDEKPFLLFISTDAPHAPATPAARHAKRFEGVRAPRVPSFNEADVSGQPAVSSSLRFTEKQIADIDDRYRDHIRSLQAVDDLVGWLMSALEQSGQLENTFIFFLSDNGLHFGEHRLLWGKGTPYEESVRVPLVVRGPGVIGGRDVAQLVTNADIFPTILDLVGLAPDENIDGRSFAPLLQSDDDDPEWRNSILLESRHLKRNQEVPRFRAIRTSRFKWIEYDDERTALYDLENDPHETTSLRGNEWNEVSEELSERMHDLLKCVGVGCWSAENRALGPASR